MTPGRRRWLWIAAGVLLVTLLSGGRWLAIETAERAWAASVTGGDVYLQGRQLARLLTALVRFIAVFWAAGHLFVVYRAIGSVQMPRRLGDLEIVEAVPHSVLLVTTAAGGVVLGLLLTWGTGDWWLTAALAQAPPTFGLQDPVLQRDAGYYTGTLPWAATLQNHVLWAVAVLVVVVALLYYGIGSLRRVDGEWRVSPHARGHLGVLLACLAAALAWGALLDPAEVVAGLHGPLDRAALDFRLPGAPVLAGVAVATGLASLAWAAFGRANLLVGGWALLAGGSLLVYVLLPGMGRGARGPDGAHVAAVETVLPAFTDAAFGPRGIAEPPPGPPTLDAAIATIPVWDPGHVAATVRVRVATGSGASARSDGVALTGPRQWLAALVPDEAALRHVSPALDWEAVHRGPGARTPAPLRAVETDSALAIDPAAGDGAAWYGAGFNQFAVARADSTPAARISGIPLRGAWRRAALAWALQSPELARHLSDGLDLLWRRDVVERLSRLAPFATFEAARPAVVHGALWWTSYGYVSSASFPLVQPVTWAATRVRYVRAGIVGAVNAATGETRLYQTPGGDSLAAAWGRVFAPLIAPPDSIPPALRAALTFPAGAFDIAVERWRTSHGERDTTTWTRRPAAPFEIAAGPTTGGTHAAVWLGQGFDTGTPARLAALLAGVMTPDGPRLVAWRAPVPVKLPTPVLGSLQVRASPERLWLVEGTPVALQAQFDDAANEPPRLLKAWISWGDRAGEGSTVVVALRNLLAAGDREPPSAEVWADVRHLLAQADSALAQGDLEAFGRLYNALKQKLLVGRRALAPPAAPR